VETRYSGLQPHLANSVLSLILLPTERCNFRCTYCYEEFAHGRMRPGVVSGVKRFLSCRVPDLEQLSIGWFGGEPLLACDIIDEIQSHAHELARRHSRMGFFASMSTNGYLLDRATCERLVELGVCQFQISVDGPREVHDGRRKLAGGGGTFDRIWDNLIAIRKIEAPFEIVVRVHIDGANHSAIPRFLEEYSRSFGEDDRFKLLLRHTSRLGGPRDDTICVLQGESGERVIDEARETARRMGLQRFHPASVPVCYASTANTFVVRSDGTLGKCTVALTDSENSVGRLFEDGRVDIDPEKMKLWMRGLFTGNADELACPLRFRQIELEKP
jgi:uncharacterized protein